MNDEGNEHEKTNVSLSLGKMAFYVRWEFKCLLYVDKWIWSNLQFLQELFLFEDPFYVKNHLTPYSNFFSHHFFFALVVNRNPIMWESICFIWIESQVVDWVLWVYIHGREGKGYLVYFYIVREKFERILMVVSLFYFTMWLELFYSALFTQVIWATEWEYYGWYYCRSLKFITIYTWLKCQNEFYWRIFHSIFINFQHSIFSSWSFQLIWDEILINDEQSILTTNPW